MVTQSVHVSAVNGINDIGTDNVVICDNQAFFNP